MTSSTGTRTIWLALMVLTTIVGLFAASQLPFLGLLVLSFAGLPALMIILAWGGTWFLLYSALTLSLSGIIGSVSLASLLVPMVFIPAIALSAAIRKKYSALGAIALALAATTIFSTGMWALSSDFDLGSRAMMPVEERFETQIAAFDELFEQIQKKGGDTANIEIFREGLYEVFDFLVLLVPITSFFVWHLITLAVFYSGAVRLAPKFGISLAQLPPFATWRFHWSLIWLFIVGWALHYGLAGIEQIPAQNLFRILGANLIAMSKIIYYIAGLSLLFFMFDKYRAGPFVRLGLSFLALVFTQAIVWFGIIDVWANFRAPAPVAISSDEDDKY